MSALKDKLDAMVSDDEGDAVKIATLKGVVKADPTNDTAREALRTAKRGAINRSRSGQFREYQKLVQEMRDATAKPKPGFIQRVFGARR